MSNLTDPEKAASHTIDEAARMLLRATPEGSEVILFGSHARGDAAAHSDVDFLVVEPAASDAWHESVRLRRHLARVPLAMDVIVVSRARFNAERGQAPSGSQRWRSVGLGHLPDEADP